MRKAPARDLRERPGDLVERVDRPKLNEVRHASKSVTKEWYNGDSSRKYQLYLDSFLTSGKIIQELARGGL